MEEKARHKKLSQKQQAFVREYLVDLNASAAARRAGYKTRSDSIAAQNMVKPVIQAAIQAEMDKRAERTKITADQVLKDIQAVKADAMQDRDGEMVDRPAALKACELQGKHLKMFTDKVDLNMSGEVDITVTRAGIG